MGVTKGSANWAPRVRRARGRAPVCSRGRGRPAMPVSISVGGAADGEDGPVGQDIPQSQDGSEIEIVASDGGVVDPVVRRAHEEPAEGPEGPAEIGVGEGGHDEVDHDGRGWDRGVGEEGDRGDNGQKEAGVDQGVGPEGGEDAHLLLGMVESVKPPAAAVKR